MPTIPKWIIDKKAKADKEREEYIKEHGEYYQFPQGETKILINTDVSPFEKINKYGKTQFVYEVQINGEKKKISVNIVLDRAIIQCLVEEINPMTIIRFGQGTQTRYSIKELSE